MDNPLYERFKAFRSRGNGIRSAILQARDESLKAPAIRGSHVAHQPEKPGVVWIENADSCFRSVIPAHNVREAGIDHEGWYATNLAAECGDSSQTIIGLVAQLPGRNGKEQFVAGFRFAEFESGQGTFDLSEIFDCESECAESANESARIEAERSREWDSAWQSGSAYAFAIEAEQESRNEILAILQERKKAPKGSEAQAPIICATLKKRVSTLLDSIYESRKMRAAILEGDNGVDSFYTGSERLRAAFCDGAGLKAYPA